MNESNGQTRSALLTVSQLRVRFGPLNAVNDVSFSLGAGDLLGLIGPNGAGKTTLLRAIATLQPLTRGAMWLFEQPLSPDVPELLQHVGFTPDNPPVYEQLSVRDFLKFIAIGYGLENDASERIDFWLEKVWLTEKADQKIKNLSRGMRQRIGIARTLLTNPNLILLDEPAAGLDPAGRVQFRQLLCSLREQGKTLIVSSHNLADMPDYCTHIGIMSRGSILRIGTVADIASHADQSRCRYTLHLAHPDNGLAGVLANVDGVSGVKIDNTLVEFEFSSNADEAAKLLARLVNAHVPVASFAPNTPDLEEAYLRTGITQVD